MMSPVRHVESIGMSFNLPILSNLMFDGWFNLKCSPVVKPPYKIEVIVLITSNDECERNIVVHETEVTLEYCEIRFLNLTSQIVESTLFECIKIHSRVFKTVYYFLIRIHVILLLVFHLFRK